MDNEAPNYARYMPEAGGYVANGKVVSKSPIYDEQGKLKLDVDASVFQTQQPTQSQNVQVANNPITNNGITTANTTGSNVDVNSTATGIGSMNSLNQNTENAIDSAISSPATRSPSAGEPILTVEQQDLKEIQDAHARNDIQGEINGYVKLARDTGVDYTQTINDLTKQRQKKIQNIDDSYLAKINEAKQNVSLAKSQGDMTGDYTQYVDALREYYSVLEEQDTWRNAVGYEDAMEKKFSQDMIDIDIDYKDTWAKAYNDISNQIIQQLPELINFQYDPTQDQNLINAQAQVELTMRNNMAATGMYYASTTQYAIAKAIGELVPIYQKMAREEAIENFKLLQSTASFLMDAEKQQFEIWKAQVQLQFDALEEKRKQYDQAVQNANARGYYTNEEAAIVGVAPGTESQAARERALDKQEKLEEEYRAYQQKIALMDLENEFNLQKIDAENRVKLAQMEYEYSLKDVQMQREYALRDRENERKAYYNNYYDNMFRGEEAPTYKITIDEDGKRKIEISGAAAYDDVTGQFVDANGNALGYDALSSNNSNSVWSGMSNMYGKVVAQAAKGTYELQGVSNLNFANKDTVTRFAEGFQKDANSVAAEAAKANGKEFSGDVNISPYLEGIYLQKAKETIDKNSSKYNSKESQTQAAVGNTTSTIQNMISSLASSGADDAVIISSADAMYKELIDTIKDAESFDFPQVNTTTGKNNVVDYNILNKQLVAVNEGVKAKEDAMITIINDMINDQSIPVRLKQPLAYSLSEYLLDYATTDAGSEGYKGLRDVASYRYLSPTTVSKIDYDSVATGKEDENKQNSASYAPPRMMNFGG